VLEGGLGVLEGGKDELEGEDLRLYVDAVLELKAVGVGGEDGRAGLGADGAQRELTEGPEHHERVELERVVYAD